MTTHRELIEHLYAERDALRAEVERLWAALPSDEELTAANTMRGMTLPQFAMLAHERDAFVLFERWLARIEAARKRER